MTSHDCNSRPWGTWAQIQEFHDSGHPHSELKDQPRLHEALSHKEHNPGSIP